jgi:ABC-type branched-subunit amino acid transport system substrate-binding protein
MQVIGLSIHLRRDTLVHFLVSNLAITCLLFLTGCVAHPKGVSLLGGTQPIVKIGLAAPFEGLDRPLVYEALAGVKSALAERNADVGGVGGYKVDLVALNDFGEPDEARLQAGEFSADPAVLGVVTGWAADTARAALPTYRQVGLAVAVPWSVSPDLADRESGVVLVAADLQQVAGVLVDAVAATDPSRLVLVGDASSTHLLTQSLRSSRLEPQVIPAPLAVSGDDDYRGWLASLFQSSEQPPDAVILATDGAKGGEVLLALTSSDWSGAIFGGVEAGSVHSVNVAGSAADGLVFVSPAPAGQDVPRSRGHSTFDGIGLAPRAVLAYDATHVLLDAIELAIQEDGYPSRRGVAAALPKVRRYGLTGEIAFDVIGRRLDAPVWLYSIEDKQYPGQLLLSPDAVSGE